MATIKHVSDGGPDGTMVGQNATLDKLGFYGSTPVVQPTDSNQAAVSSTAIAAVTSTVVVSSTGVTVWGFSGSAQGTSVLNTIASLVTQANSRATQVETIRANLVTLGLIKGS